MKKEIKINDIKTVAFFGYGILNKNTCEEVQVLEIHDNYVIVKRKYEDKLYKRVLRKYLGVYAVWIKNQIMVCDII